MASYRGSQPVPLGEPGRGGPTSERARAFPGPAHAGPDMAPPAQAAGPNLPSLLRALRRRWKPVMALGLLLGAAAASATWALIPPAKYAARAILHVSTTPPKLVFDHEFESDYRTFQQTQATLINSRLVLNAALADEAVKRTITIAEQDDPVEWLAKQLTVKFPGGSEILELGLSGDRPADLPVIINAVVRSYLFNMVEKETRDRKERYVELKKIYDRHQELLETYRGRLNGLAESVGSGDRKTQEMKHQLALEHQNKAQNELLQVQSELRKARVEESALEAGAESRSSVPDWQINDRMANDAILQGLRAKLVLAQRQNAQVTRTARDPGDPSRLEALRREKSAEQEVVECERRLRKTIIARIAGEEEQKGRDQRIAAQERARMLTKFEEVLAQELKGLADRDHTFTKQTLDFQSVQDEIELVGETAKKVGTLMQAIDVEVQAPPRIRLLDGAVIPRAKDDKKRVKIAGAAGLGLFTIVALGFTYWEYQLRRIDTGDEVARSLGVQLMGVLPISGASARRTRELAPIPRSRDPSSPLVESLTALRTLLLHASGNEGLRVLMITSAMKGEGKTSLSCHLATSLAYAGRRTLLIDCDLRNPSVNRVFDQPLGPGLSELLRKECAIQEVVRPTPQPNLMVITAGQSDSLALQSLALTGLKETFDDLARGCDFLIVDSPPVLPVADSLLISQHVDAVILSVMRDVSRIHHVREAHDRLAALGVRILGAVMNGVDVPSVYY
jgi:polysaccharide biosynthesis transport protein